MATLAYATLWAFVFSLPWQGVVVLAPGVNVIGKATGAVALACALVVAVISGRVRRWHLFHVAALLFVVWLGSWVFLFSEGDRLPLAFWTFVQLFLMVWMIWELAPSQDRLVGLLLAYVLGAHVSALDTIMSYRHAGDLLKRYAAGGLDPNDTAMTLALALPMAWYLGMTFRKPLLRWVCRGYLATGLLAIGLTGSRGGMIATTIALSIVPLTMRHLSPGRRAAAIGILALAGVLVVAFIPDKIVKRLATTSSEVEGGGISGRGKLWRAGLIVFVDKPITGYGPGDFRAAVRPLLGSMTQVAHNSYISVLVEEGLVGFLLYMTMVGSAWLAVLRLPQLERRFALVLLATLAIAMLPLTWEDRKPVWFILAAMVGLGRAAQLAMAPAEGRVLPPRPVPPPSARAARGGRPMAPARHGPGWGAVP